MSDANWGSPYAANPAIRYSQYDPAQPYGGQYPAQGGYAGQAQPYGYADPAPEPGEPDLPPAPRGPGAFSRALHGAGALLSVALIAGLAVWGYKLAMRDVTGVPVVRALEGPMRIQPEDPGGVAAAHQGLAVNSVAAEGQAEGPAEQVALAPAAMGLSEDDMPAMPDEEVSAVSMVEAGDAPLADPVARVEAEPETVALVDDETGETAAGLAIANAVAAAAEPLSGEEADLSIPEEVEPVLASVRVAASVPGVARSPRPQPRPAALVTRAAASPVDLAIASAAAAAPASVRDVAASAIATGTRLVQLGAFDSEEIARGEWDKLALRFPEMLEGKDRVIQQAQSGGKTFYRLRAMGFDDLSDARRFCAALMAGQAACIPVVTR
ncbi:SPOR domain-containing protein [Sinisalibacter aestuarii]|uniref:Sporulation protein n=1 Tax=Sinisalibacter aestuarii TaxID=2949426 RepID=A0ABQ5LRL1_9RHOB|nr:SPOR domain-containing protein [Sinisalibacter aestuarii]GKY87564.1 sporulation protein [Sinisalibacter aestuarii]